MYRQLDDQEIPYGEAGCDPGPLPSLLHLRLGHDDQVGTGEMHCREKMKERRRKNREYVKNRKMAESGKT